MSINHINFKGILQNEAKLMVEWFEISAMRVNPDKFQGMLLKVWVILRLQSRAMKSLLCRKSMHWVCV